MSLKDFKAERRHHIIYYEQEWTRNREQWGTVALLLNRGVLSANRVSDRIISFRIANEAGSLAVVSLYVHPRGCSVKGCSV